VRVQGLVRLVPVRLVPGLPAPPGPVLPAPLGRLGPELLPWHS
jgi:hypothetical protein